MFFFCSAAENTARHLFTWSIRSIFILRFVWVLPFFLYLARVCFRYRVETVAMEFVKNMSMFIDANLFFVQIFKCVFVAAENWGENGF